MSISCRCISSGSSDSASICSRVSTRAERIAAAIGRARLRILRDVDRILEILDQQDDDVAVVALADPHLLQYAGIETRETPRAPCSGPASGRRSSPGRSASS